MKYKLRHLEDDIYQVYEINEDGDEKNYWVTCLFQGTLPECEAWINLTEKGYL